MRKIKKFYYKNVKYIDKNIKNKLNKLWPSTI